MRFSGRTQTCLLAALATPVTASCNSSTSSVALTSTSTGPTATAIPYQLKTGPLDTPWTKDVGTNPWPEHPRPQLFRDQWQTLNGIWTYQPAGGPGDLSKPPSYPLAKEVLVPSCIESAISGIMDRNVTYMWFATSFSLPDQWLSPGALQRVLLNFEAVDYEATVFVNGVQVGQNRGGYFRFSFDITDQLSLQAKNEM